MAVVCSLILGIAPAARAGPFDVEIEFTAYDAAAGNEIGLSVAVGAC